MTERHVLWSADDHTPTRQTVDLEAYPDLVVIYIGMRVQRPKGLLTMARYGRRMKGAMDPAPEGLLHWDRVFYELFPPHVGVRQYWKDFESLEAWARTSPHKDWWVEYLKDQGGTGFWHEVYLRSGEFEAIYDGLHELVGLGQVGEVREAKGSLFTAPRRARRELERVPGPPVPEESLYPGQQQDGG